MSIRTATGSRRVDFTVIALVSKLIYRHNRAFSLYRRVESADSRDHWVGDRRECVKTLRVFRTGHLIRENNTDMFFHKEEINFLQVWEKFGMNKIDCCNLPLFSILIHLSYRFFCHLLTKNCERNFPTVIFGSPWQWTWFASISPQINSRWERIRVGRALLNWFSDSVYLITDDVIIRKLWF